MSEWLDLVEVDLLGPGRACRWAESAAVTSIWILTWRLLLVVANRQPLSPMRILRLCAP
jgi:hypothetical protein